MEKTKIEIVLFTLIFIFFGIYFEKKVEVTSTNIKSGIKDSSFFSNLKKKKLENNSITAHNNNQKKNVKSSISSNSDVYNKKITRLKTEDEKSLDLYRVKPSIILKNNYIRTKPLNIVYIEKSVPYLSNTYISNEGKRKKLGNTSYSFIQKETSELIDIEVLNDYNSLITVLNGSYTNAKNIYMNSHAYKEMEHYFKELQDDKYNEFRNVIIPLINNMTELTQQYMKYCEECKEKIAKEMNELHEFIGNFEEVISFTEKISELKKNIKDIKAKLDEDFKVIRQKKGEVHDKLSLIMSKKYCTLLYCDKVKPFYGSAVTYYYSKTKKDMSDYTDFLQEAENFINSDNKLLKIRDKNFYHKKYKYSLKLLIEEINVIISIHKKNKGTISNNIRVLKYSNSYYSSCKFSSNNIVNIVISPSVMCNENVFVEDWNKKLKIDFENKKKAIYDLFDKIKQELWDSINSLVYPQDIESQSVEITSQSQKLLSDTNSMIYENCETLDDLSYSSPGIPIIKHEITKLYAEVVTHSINMNSSFDLINKKCDSIKSKKNKIETMKASLPLNESKTLNDITDDVFTTKQNIERIITSVNDKIEVIQSKHKEISEIKKKIEGLIEQIKTKKGELDELERKEDEEKEQYIKKIEHHLKEIEEKVNKLNQFIDLKNKDNEYLKVIENVIDASSCNNKDEYTKKKEEAKEQWKSALTYLFGDERIEKKCKDMPVYLSEKKKSNYMIFDLDTINNIFNNLNQKYIEIDNIIIESTTIVNDKIASAESNFIQLRDRIIKESIEDLHNKMNNSFQQFNNILNSISQNMTNYKANIEKFKILEDSIEKRKHDILDKLIEEDSDTLKEDTSTEILNLENVIRETKNLISTNISDGRSVVYTFQKQFESYDKIQNYFGILKNNEISDNINDLKTTIHEIKADSKLNDYETKYRDETNSIDDSIKKVELSKKVIESFNILNKVINGSNKNNESIEYLKTNLRESEEKIDRQILSVNEDNLIENQVKGNLLSKLREKKNMEDQKRKIDKLDKDSKELQKLSLSFKKTTKSSLTEENIEAYSGDISKKKKNLESITDEIYTLKVGITKLNLEVDNLINTQNNEIADLIYELIIRLDLDINSKTKAILGILEVTKNSFEKYNSEEDIKNIHNEKNGENLRAISQNFSNFKDEINTYNENFIKIQNDSKKEVDKSDELKYNNENFDDKRINMKRYHDNIKKISENLDEMEKELETSLKNINKKKVEYKKILVIDILDQISDNKKGGEKEITIIDEYKEKIEELKEKIPDSTECELVNFKYEDYVNNAKKNKEIIIKLEQEVNSLRETVSKDIKEDEINRIQMEVKKKLNEIIKEKNKIDNASEALKNMGKFLMLTKFSIVMDEIQSNVKKVREEEKNAEKKFIESENIQKNILDDLKKVEELQNLLIHNLDEDSINGSIEKVILIKDRTESNSENINMLLTEVEKHKETSSLYLNNTIRGREKIEYLKKHDNDETQNITEAVMQNINNYVHESENCSKNAERHAQETSKNYTLSLEYTKEVNDLLKDSLILAEKMKVEMKKNYVIDMLIEIQDSYYDNKYILERLKERLIKINQEDINMKCEYEANNEKSI
ncbi:reticulocyte binding protein, putative, partial [Plasmodium relictum]